jgi:hypothetical protein
VSHHLDAPQAGQNGQLYIDDMYAFSADGSTVLVMDVSRPRFGAWTGPIRSAGRTLNR